MIELSFLLNHNHEKVEYIYISVQQFQGDFVFKVIREHWSRITTIPIIRTQNNLIQQK